MKRWVGLGGRDGGAQAGAAGADDGDIGLEGIYGAPIVLRYV